MVEAAKVQDTLKTMGFIESSIAAKLAGLHAGKGLFDDLTIKLAHTVDPFASALKAAGAWEHSLSSRLAKIDADWLRPDDLGVSMLGFARIARLSDAVHGARPFSPEVAELVTDELGTGADPDDDASPSERDAAAITAGLKSDLIAFPMEAYDQVVVAAGFQFVLPATPVPVALEAGDPDAMFHPTYYALLNHLEQCLRQFVSERLDAFVGKPWVKQRVAEGVRKRWHDRQTEERDARRPVYDLIQYADFMDLVEVICRNDNWKDVFAATFGSKDELQVSLRRLHPVRKAIAHGRPLGRYDRLTLVNEVTRILKAIGINLLQ